MLKIDQIPSEWSMAGGIPLELLYSDRLCDIIHSDNGGLVLHRLCHQSNI